MNCEKCNNYIIEDADQYCSDCIYQMEQRLINNHETIMNFLNSYLNKTREDPEEIFQKNTHAITQDKSEDICPICHENNVSIQSKCGHYFCSQCLKQWFRQQPTCPTCRCEFS